MLGKRSAALSGHHPAVDSRYRTPKVLLATQHKLRPAVELRSRSVQSRSLLIATHHIKLEPTCTTPLKEPIRVVPSTHAL